MFCSFSPITRGRTRPTDEGDVINGDISRLSSNCSLQNHLVDLLQHHMGLHQQPLIPLISRFLPHLQERRRVIHLQWGCGEGFATPHYANCATCTPYTMNWCYFAIRISQLCEQYDNGEKKLWKQIFLNQLHCKNPHIFFMQQLWLKNNDNTK